jgi:hypothetical protein
MRRGKRKRGIAISCGIVSHERAEITARTTMNQRFAHESIPNSTKRTDQRVRQEIVRRGDHPSGGETHAQLPAQRVHYNFTHRFTSTS